MISSDGWKRSSRAMTTLGIVYAREVGFEPRTAPAREPRSRAMRRRLSAVARGRCADRRRARRVPGEHHRSLLDLARRGPHQGQVDPRDRGPDSVQLPDRQGRGEDSAAQAGDPRWRARDPAGRLQERAGRDRVAQACGVQPRAHAAAADSASTRRRASTTSASDSRAPRSIPSGSSAASSSSGTETWH